MEISYFVAWYLYLFILGIIGLPITSVVFKSFKDKGYGFAKIVGLIITAFPIWILSSLRIVEFSELSTLFSVSFFAIVSIFILSKSDFKINKYMIIEEVLFFIVLLTWSYIRSTNPRAEGTEKMMNLSFMNSINRTSFFPPKDMWFSGGTINYYYIGHYFYTFLSKVTSVPISAAYNLSLNFIIAQFFISLYSIFIKLFNNLNFRAQNFTAFLGSFVISFGGNLFLIFKILESLITKEEFKYFFPNSTRIIPYTINEYPSYSVVLGDLHGHYNSIPFFILCIGFSLIYSKINPFSKKKIIFSLIISPVIMMLYGINSWDLITVNILFLLINFFSVLSKKEFLYDIFKLKKFKKFRNQIEYLLRMLYILVLQILLLVPGLILILPYILNFHPAVGGIGFAPLGVKSEPLLWFLIWGGFVIVSVLFFVFYFTKNFNTKFINLRWILILFITSIGLIIGVEFFFIKDLFYEVNRNYFRTNTVFKFYYHAWILWGIVSVYFGKHLLSNLKKTIILLENKQLLNLTNRLKIDFILKKLPNTKIIKSIVYFSIVFLYLTSIIYIFRAISDFYPLENIGKGTLDGSAYIYNEHHSDAEAISWINENIEDQPIMLETFGEAYTYYSRISANTGLITVIGWPTHEWQWRHNIDEINERKKDVEIIYTTDNKNILKNKISKYAIQYIFVGELERKIDGFNIDLIDNEYESIYQNDDVVIYKVY